jgi:polyhydroxyalkanoate synthase
VERFLTLDDYVNRYLVDIFEVVREHTGYSKISVLGYCVGGDLALMYAALYPLEVENLILMATPVDFQVPGLLNFWAREEYFDVDILVELFGNVPPEFMNPGFTLAMPLQTLVNRYIEFFQNLEDREYLATFFGFERWRIDGVPVAGETFRQFVKDCYQHNLLIKNKLTIGEKIVNLKNITMPILSYIAEFDEFIPPASSTALHGEGVVSSVDKTVVSSPTGHVPLSIGELAHSHYWHKIVAWLAARTSLRGSLKKPLS